jgi:hypothetical protein
MTRNIFTPSDIFEHLTKRYAQAFSVTIRKPVEQHDELVAYHRAGSLALIERQTTMVFYAGNVIGNIVSGHMINTHLGLSYRTGENFSGLAMCNLDRLELHAKTNPIAKQLVVSSRRFRDTSHDDVKLTADLSDVPIGFIDQFVMWHYR